MTELSLETLPDIASARLPQAYQSAVNALAECSRLDECQSWADKAEAIASYARQAKDEQLRKMADRIQARAIRRCGELLKQIEPQQGGDKGKNQHGEWQRDGAGPMPTRTQAAINAGLSERQRKTSLRVANVPDDDFNEAVESDNPPTVTQLAEAGTSRKAQVDTSMAKAQAQQLKKTLVKFSNYCSKHPPDECAALMDHDQAADLRYHIATVDRWLDVLSTRLPV